MLIDGDPPFLPHEIITNILKRLPVKSLIRFQCVCKRWKNLLNTPSFISDHFHHSSLQNPSLLFQLDSRDSHSSSCRPLNLFLLDCDMQVREVQDAPLIDSFSYAWIVGSSNGLLCVKIHPYFLRWSEREKSPPYLLLWNPAIRDVRPVPIRTSIKESEGKWISGFGFSKIVNDYKIVRFFVSKIDDLVKQVEVYSVSKGSWKEIDFDLEGTIHSCSETVSADGLIFWHGSKAGLAEDDDLMIIFSRTDREPKIGSVEEDDFILSFDITTEVFAWMPWPSLDYSRPKLASYDNKLTVYDNKLALLSHTRIGDFLCPSCLIDLWVMEKGTSATRERWSWTKKHTIATSSGIYLHQFSIWRNDIVCKVYESTEPVADVRRVTVLSLFNPDTHEIKKFTIPNRGNRISAVFNHVESLVSVGNIHIEEPSSSS